MDKKTANYYAEFHLYKVANRHENHVVLQYQDRNMRAVPYGFLKYLTPVNNIRMAETCAMMISDEERKRFKAEYIQLKERYLHLKEIVSLWDDGKLFLPPSSPREIYGDQLEAMEKYISALEKRAEFENVDLDY